METMKISDIIVDMEINTVDELDQNLVEEYKLDMLGYGPGMWQDVWKQNLQVTEDGHLWSGFHTLEAARRAFGDEYEIEVSLHGLDKDDALLLATGENAHRGRRRSNAEKRTVVLRWLTHPDGKQWTNSFIAKQCHVGKDLVISIANEITSDKESDIYDPAYERPTALKYKDRYGNEGVMETANIGLNSTDVKKDKTKVDPDKRIMDAFKAFRNRLPDALAKHPYLNDQFTLPDMLIPFLHMKGIQYQPIDGLFLTSDVPIELQEELIENLQDDFYRDFAQLVFNEVNIRLGTDVKMPTGYATFDESDIRRQFLNHYSRKYKFEDMEGDIKLYAEKADISKEEVREIMQDVEKSFNTSLNNLAVSVDTLASIVNSESVIIDIKKIFQYAKPHIGHYDIELLIKLYNNPKEYCRERFLSVGRIAEYRKVIEKISEALLKPEKERDAWIVPAFQLPSEMTITAEICIKQDGSLVHFLNSDHLQLAVEIDYNNEDTHEKLEKIMTHLGEQLKFQLGYEDFTLVIEEKEEDED